jgi:hypothetical protein
LSSEYRYRIEIPPPGPSASRAVQTLQSDPCRCDRQPILSTKARSTRVPHPPAHHGRRTTSFSQPRRRVRHDRPSLLSVRPQVQSQAFVRFAVAGSAAIRLSRSTDLRSGTNRPARLSGICPWRSSVNTAQRGLHRCCSWNVVAPGRYSKTFFCLCRPLPELF